MVTAHGCMDATFPLDLFCTSYPVLLISCLPLQCQCPMKAKDAKKTKNKCVFGPGAGIKAQVCSLVELLVTTLFQAYSIFYLPPEGGPRSAEGALSCGMLFSILENVTSPTTAGKQLGCPGNQDTFSVPTDSYFKGKGQNKRPFLGCFSSVSTPFIDRLLA